MKPILYSLTYPREFLESLNQASTFRIGELVHHAFPDHESLIQIKDQLQDQQVIFVESLADPNTKTLPLIFAAETARSLGATQVGLCAPYLPYMRQDKVFHPGEGITSSYYAKLISAYFSGLITVDPHLHRYVSLDAVYTIPNKVVASGSAIARWLTASVSDPFIIGPDEESEQWVSEIAHNSGCRYVTLQKTRHGDFDVAMEVPELKDVSQCTPVFIDDIISSGSTMLKAWSCVKSNFSHKPIAVAVHALFDDSGLSKLKDSFQQLVTTNSIIDPTNAIDLAPELHEALTDLF